MSSFNRVILMGNITRDIELRYTPSGTPVTEIGMAVNDRVKRGDEWVDEPTYVDVTLWGKTAELVSQYLSKGKPIFVEGRLKFEQWEQDGQKRSKLKVVGERMQFVGGREGGSGGGGNQESFRSANSAPPASQPAASAAPPPEDDIPF